MLKQRSPIRLVVCYHAALKLGSLRVISSRFSQPHIAEEIVKPMHPPCELGKSDV